MEQTISKQMRRELTRICSVEFGIAWITLDRPEKANAVSSSLLGDIVDAMDAAEADSEVRAVIFSGAGRNFCAGADLTELLEGGAKAVRRLLNNFREVCLKFERSPLPVIGMVHGAARAGGLELILCCDATVAADNATIGDAHSLRELLPGGGGSVRLPRTIGHQRAKWMILSGTSIGAAQALDWGILQAMVPLGELQRSAIDLANQMSVAKPETIARAKSLLFKSDELPFLDALENEIVTLEEHSLTKVMQDGLMGFVKR